MIQRVYEQASKAGSIDHLLVATDHNKIYDHVKAFGGNVVMTSRQHKNGTERCLEAYQISSSGSGSNSKRKSYDFVVNIQGDEPFIIPEQINILISSLNNQNIEIATLVKKTDNRQELFDPNVPKVIFDKNFNAIYFSRQTIPNSYRYTSRAAYSCHIPVKKYTNLYFSIPVIELNPIY